MFVTWKIEVAPYDGTTEPGTWGALTALTSFYQPDVQMSLGDGRDSFNFKITNFNDQRLDLLNPNDKVYISRTLNSTVTSTSDLLMVGTVSAVVPEENERLDLIRIEGYNFSETIMSGIVFVDAISLPVAAAITSALNSLSVYASQYAVTWNASNPSLKQDGVTVFPVAGEKYFNKPVKTILEKLSTNEATADGIYYWYVNKDNELVWRPRTSATSGSFNNQTDAYQSLKIGKDIKDIKNYIILKGGLDPSNKNIQTKYYDAASVAKNRARYHILVDENKTASTLYTADSAKAGLPSLKDAFPAGFVPTWTSTSYATYALYLTAFRDHIKNNILVPLGQQFVEQRKDGKLSITISFQPGKGWILGQLIPCTITAIGPTVKNLRVTDIQYTTDEDIFTLVEDLGSL